MNTTTVAALYVVLPALLLLAAPAVVHALHSLYDALRSIRMPDATLVASRFATLLACPLALLAVVWITVAPVVAPNTYLRTVYDMHCREAHII